MRKLTALGIMTLTVTSMIPLTANAAVVRSYSQCNTGRSVVTINGNCNFNDLKEKLQQYGIDENQYNWKSVTNDWNNCKQDNRFNFVTNGDTKDDDNKPVKTVTKKKKVENTESTEASKKEQNKTETETKTNPKKQAIADRDPNINTSTDSVKETASKPDNSNKSYSQQVVDLINEERAEEGLAPLSIDPRVEKAASVRASELQKNFEHTRPNGGTFSSAIKEQGAKFSGAGENIAWGQKTPQEVVDSWMKSPGHRDNILSKDYKYIGVGNSQDGSGTQYWVQLFTY